ncbi:MAG: PD-(D/E)XK nuclease family protein [Candidatus Acetothermia bacterium]|jgi:CRISPR/Cas system-associated exonuclease Cas4 (RecB family)|nr:PD-(D/E)XK nuclease family protein [Candidatus Acetothermia bacterium]
MLAERLEEFFQREERARARDYFYVSEVSKCPRQIYYAVKGFPKPPLDGLTARKLAVGEDAHRRLVQALYGLGVVVAAEVPIPPGKLFHGRADTIVSVDGKNYVVEIKTVHPYNFDQMAAAPRRDHYLQLQLYLHYFAIPQGIILAENKATQELREFLVDLDREAVDRVIRTFEQLRQQIFVEGRLPPLPDRSDWEFDQCRYCPYQAFCTGDVAVLPGQGKVEEVQPALALGEEREGPRTLFDELD